MPSARAAASTRPWCWRSARRIISRSMRDSVGCSFSVSGTASGPAARFAGARRARARDLLGQIRPASARRPARRARPSCRTSLCSCRTLPGHGKSSSCSIASSDSRTAPFAEFAAAAAATKWFTSSGISSRRSRSGLTRQPDDVEAVEEVFAEAAVAAPPVASSGVGGRDHADRHRRRRRLAERQDFARLEEAQQLGLEVEAELADLVEEQRALARGADDAGVVAVGAGEGAAAVAEQLAFEHLARDGGAVERDERAVGAIGVRVDGAREDLLARAALAGDEDADVRARDAPRDRIRSRRCPVTTASPGSGVASSIGQRVRRSSRSARPRSSSFTALSRIAAALTQAAASASGRGPA